MIRLCDELVDEMIVSFTHSKPIPWMLPGIEARNRAVRIPGVAIIGFRDNKLAHEHIYWDQASLLKQIWYFDRSCASDLWCRDG